MMDHHYVYSDGRRVPVSEMPTSLIQDILADGSVDIIPDGNETVDDVMERLRIEIVARALPQQ